MKIVLKLLTAWVVLMLGLGMGSFMRYPSPQLLGARVARVEAGGATIFLPAIRRDFLPPVDLGISRVEVIQGTTMSNAYEVHIANRAATMRVFASFASTDGSTSVGNISALLTCNPGTVQVSAGPITVFQSSNEGNLSHTFNFNLPAGCLAMGASYNIQIDSANAVVESNEGNNRWPAGGDTSFNYLNPDAVKVMFVPIDYRPQGCGGPSYLPNTSTQDYLTTYPIKVWPVSAITYLNWHAPVQFCLPLGDFTGENWGELLDTITTVHSNEGNIDTLYYGVVNIVGAGQCSGGCVAGLGWLGSPTAVGFSGFSGGSGASWTFTHEAGHNFDRSHAPGCGAAGADPGYPASYINGAGRATIGQYGLDVASSTLYAPATTFDYMSYCGPEWTSDYTYKAIYDFRQINPWLVNAADQQAATVFSGGFTTEGQAQVWNVSRHAALIPAATATGTHRAELLDARGNVLAARAFTPAQIQGDVTGPEHLISGFDLSGFNVALPVVDGAATLRLYEGEHLVFERTVAGAAPELKVVDSAVTSAGVTARWQLTAGAADTTFHVRFSPDGGQTWTVLALNTATPSLTVPTHLLAGATQPMVEVQATDGVRVTTLTIDLK